MAAPCQNAQFQSSQSLKNMNFRSLARFLVSVVFAVSCPRLSWERVGFGKTTGSWRRFRQHGRGISVMLAILLLEAWMPSHVAQAAFQPGKYSNEGVSITIENSGSVAMVEVSGDDSGFAGHTFVKGADLEASGDSWDLSGSWSDRIQSSNGYLLRECDFSAWYDGNKFKGRASYSYDAYQSNGGYDGSNGAQWDFSIAIPLWVPPVPPPTLSPAGGAYASTAVEVTVSCLENGATIRYTTDGNEPTESSSSRCPEH